MLQSNKHGGDLQACRRSAIYLFSTGPAPTCHTALAIAVDYGAYDTSATVLVLRLFGHACLGKLL